MDLGLKGRTAIVCAASQGLGKASAMALAHEGVDLVIAARRGDVLAAAAAEIASATGHRPRTVIADVTTREGRGATGLRRGDAARVGKQHVKNGVISIQTEKTGTWVHIPILPALARTLEAGPTGDLTFVVTSSGKPYKKEALGNEFKEWCRESGVMDKSAHGLRKIAATHAAENGATVNELMSIFG